jgi:precorrin-6B methylase 2
MKKIIFIEDRSRRRFLLRNALKFFNYETYIVSADSMNKLIDEATPDYVFINIKEPVNEEDMKSVFENLRSDHRLRVRIINISNHKLKFSNILSFELFDNMINSANEKIYKPLLCKKSRVTDNLSFIFFPLRLFLVLLLLLIFFFINRI